MMITYMPHSIFPATAIISFSLGSSSLGEQEELAIVHLCRWNKLHHQLERNTVLFWTRNPNPILGMSMVVHELSMHTFPDNVSSPHNPLQ
jgi:hypothetical protein